MSRATPAKKSAQTAQAPAKPVAAPAATNNVAPPVPHEQIAMRAYEKWCGRGMPAGSDLQDWIEAEKELRAECMTKPAGRR